MQKYIYNINEEEMNIDYDYLFGIESKIKDNEELIESEINYYLTSLLCELKKKLNTITNDDSYKGLCSYAQCALHYHLESLNVKHYMHRTINTIDKDCTDHYFLIADFNVMSKPISYILDPTYKQFFTSEICFKDDNEIKIPGKYYINHPEFKDIIIDFLDKGFIPMNDNTIKMYGDSFYYSKKMPDGCLPELPTYIYKKLFKKEDGVVAKDKNYLQEIDIYPIITQREKRL